MVGLRITGPSFDRGTTAAQAKRAVDAALANHRRQFLPFHFQPGALSRYPEAYQDWKPNASKREKARAEISAKIDAMSPDRRAQFLADKRAKIGDLAQRYPEVGITGKRDRKRTRPLVETGRAEQAILHGFAEFTGPLARRRLVLQPPWYFLITSRGQGQTHDKVAAVEAIAADENETFAKVADEALADWYGD